MMEYLAGISISRSTPRRCGAVNFRQRRKGLRGARLKIDFVACGRIVDGHDGGMDWIGYALLGLVAGIASGSLGIGGGALIVPALTLWFKVPYTVAVGTSLALIIPISLAGATMHQRFGNLDWRIFTACAIAGVMGAIAGALLIQKIPELYARRAFAVFLLYAAWRLWFK